VTSAAEKSAAGAIAFFTAGSSHWKRFVSDKTLFCAAKLH
jgi:hypothetical protein